MLFYFEKFQYGKDMKVFEFDTINKIVDYVCQKGNLIILKKM